MYGSRRRVAIGIFATAEEAAATMARLRRLGIMRHECLSLPDDHVPSALSVARAVPATPTPAAGPVMVRTYLDTMAEEQVVVAALLESAAQSVQLHDIDSDGAD